VCVLSRLVVQLWCVGKKPPGDSVTDVETTLKIWGIGANIITRLLNREDEVRFMHQTCPHGSGRVKIFIVNFGRSNLVENSRNFLFFSAGRIYPFVVI